MFTLKFVEYIDNLTPTSENPCKIITDVLSCERYSVREYEKFIEVVIPRFNDTMLVMQIANRPDGEQVYEGLRQGYYNVCYVENASGKTIDTIHKMTQ